jgi:FMN reductase
MTRILGISGSMREGSVTRRLVHHALSSAEKCGASIELLDLRHVILPVFNADLDYDKDENVARVIQMFDEADAFILGSPEYHGCMSGATKNLLDFLYREIAGKVFGLISGTGGSQGVGCFDNMRAAIQYCHGWVLPYNVSATGRDFDSERKLSNPKVIDRLDRLGRDVTIYGPVLRGQFQQDINQPSTDPPGFAHWSA